MLRRAGFDAGQQLAFDNVRLDRGTRQVTRDGMPVQLSGPRPLRRSPDVVLALHRPACRAWQSRGEHLHVLLIEAGPPNPFAPFRLSGVVAEPRKATQRERVRPEHASDEVVLDVVAHPLNDRDDRDEEHDADRHAEQREEALEFLNANLR